MNFKCSMNKKKESLIKKNEDAGRRTTVEVGFYDILEVHQNGKQVKNFQSTKCDTADELYKALDRICGGSTKGNLTVIEEQPESYIEGYLDLSYSDSGTTWVFRVWVMVDVIDTMATAINDLGL